MSIKDYLEVLTFVCSIAVVVVVGRSNIKKQVISDLQALVLAHEQTINQLKLENIQLRKDNEEAAQKAARDSAAKDERILALEETIDGYSDLVRKGYLLGSSGPRGRDRSTSTKTTKNRES